MIRFELVFSEPKKKEKSLIFLQEQAKPLVTEPWALFQNIFINRNGLKIAKKAILCCFSNIFPNTEPVPISYRINLLKIITFSQKIPFIFEFDEKKNEIKSHTRETRFACKFADKFRWFHFIDQLANDLCPLSNVLVSSSMITSIPCFLYIFEHNLLSFFSLSIHRPAWANLHL